MYRFKSIKYLCLTGVITGLLFVVGYISGLFFSWVGTTILIGTTLQLFDVFFISFCAIFKGPMMLFAGSIAGALFDLVSSVRLATIPATIIIRILMFVVIKILITNQWWSSFYVFFIASLFLVFGYPLYYILVYQDKAKVISSLINNAIQGAVAYIFSVSIYYYLNKLQSNSFHSFWDDSQFDNFKKRKKQKLEENLQENKKC